MPVHSGTAGRHGLFSDHIHDLGFIKEILGRWAYGLDITRLGGLAACVSVVPVVWRFVTAAWTEAYTCIRQFFIASVKIPGRDPLNRSVMSWVMTQIVQHRENRSFTARTQVQGGDLIDRAALLKRKRRDIQYLPHFETTWFWHHGSLFFLSRSLDDFHASMTDPSYDGVGGEELVLGCLGRSTEPIKKLIQTCRDYSDRQTEYFVIIYARDRYGMSWQPKARKPIRRLSTVHFDDAVKQALLADMRKYLDPNTKRLYQSRSMPYRRGYLFFGPPGTGKSSLSTALAGEFGLDLYELKIPCVATDQDLEHMFQEVPPQCIVLLEDVDAIWTDRDSDKDDRNTTSNSRCTLSGLLNVLDGVGSQEGRIVIMTTNKPERLDSALIRPGRVDFKVMLGNISRKSAQDMFIRMFTPDVEHSPLIIKGDAEGVVVHNATVEDSEHLRVLAAQFSKHIPNDTLSPSQLQGFFQLHLDNANEAVAHIAYWIERELSKSALDDDISVISEEKT
ncbi:P-loop containing nucleoside triphosphate hydrolase protein [Xylariaceae sp. FL1272]|nr:P-loop containing nucleoside triphosphate hydrolase protein [Xylariaceae sp. FL1272]